MNLKTEGAEDEREVKRRGGELFVSKSEETKDETTSQTMVECSVIRSAVGLDGRFLRQQLSLRPFLTFPFQTTNNNHVLWPHSLPVL